MAVGQTTAPQSQPQPAGSQPAATQQPGTAPAAGQPGAPAQPQKKEIKDPAEYNAYVSAVQQKDPAAQISGLEAFLTQYPNSVVKEDALERSEEHTSELQSPCNLVCRLLLEKKKKKK